MDEESFKRKIESFSDGEVKELHKALIEAHEEYVHAVDQLDQTREVIGELNELMLQAADLKKHIHNIPDHDEKHDFAYRLKAFYDDAMHIEKEIGKIESEMKNLEHETTDDEHELEDVEKGIEQVKTFVDKIKDLLGQEEKEMEA